MNVGTATPVQTPGTDEKLWSPTDDEDYTGWFCIETDPYPCPRQCSFVANHATVCHYILIWPERDDPSLLSLAAEMKRVARNPRVADYKASLGPAVNYYAWESAVRPKHDKP